MSSTAQSRVRALERRVARQRCHKGNVLVVKVNGKFSRDGHKYETLEELRETEGLQDAELIVFALSPSKWRPN